MPPSRRAKISERSCEAGDRRRVALPDEPSIGLLLETMCCSCSQQHDVVVDEPGNPTPPDPRSGTPRARPSSRSCSGAHPRSARNRRNPATAAPRCATARSAPSPSRRRTTRWRRRRTTSGARTRPVRFPHSCDTGSEGCSSTCTRAPPRGAASTPTSAGPTASSAPISPRVSSPPGSQRTGGSGHLPGALPPTCTCATGSASWVRSGSAPSLARFARFLDENPREVLVIVFEDHLSTDRIADALRTSGLAPMLLPVEVGQPLPTLGAMIAFGTAGVRDAGERRRRPDAPQRVRRPGRRDAVHVRAPARAPSRGFVRARTGATTARPCSSSTTG